MATLGTAIRAFLPTGIKVAIPAPGLAMRTDRLQPSAASLQQWAKIRNQCCPTGAAFIISGRNGTGQNTPTAGLQMSMYPTSDDGVRQRRWMTENRDYQITGTDHGSHLVHLIINQDTTSQEWMKFFFTIQSALAAAYLFGINVVDRLQWAPRWFTPAISFIIPFLGIIFARSLTRIVVRQNQWQAWFIQKYNALPGNADSVFPKDDKPIVSVSDQPDGYATTIVRRLGRFIVFTWTVTALMTVYAFFGADLERLLTAQ
jgi:hypothetical protein